MRPIRAFWIQKRGISRSFSRLSASYRFYELLYLEPLLSYPWPFSQLRVDCKVSPISGEWESEILPQNCQLWTSELFSQTSEFSQSGRRALLVFACETEYSLSKVSSQNSRTIAADSGVQGSWIRSKRAAKKAALWTTSLHLATPPCIQLHIRAFIKRSVSEYQSPD